MSSLRPCLNLQFAKAHGLDPRITFSRSTTATKFNKKGLLETCAINEPRIDYDPLTGECLGFLIEEQRTNVALYCRDLTNAAWVKSNCTAAKTQTGIDGAANSCSLLTASASNATCLQSITLASSDRYQSAYIKRSAGTGFIYMTQDGGATWTDITASINSAAFALVEIPTQTLTNPEIGFKIATSGDAIIVDYVQNENGKSATSPILTTSVSQTRNGDIPYISGISQWYRQDEGTFVIEHKAKMADGNGTGRIFSLNDNSFANCVTLRHSSTGSTILRAEVIISSVSSGMLMTLGAFNILHKTAVAYKKSNHIAYTDVTSSATSGTSSTLPALTRLDIGVAHTGIGQFNGHIKSLIYFPNRLSNAEASALTL